MGMVTSGPATATDIADGARGGTNKVSPRPQKRQKLITVENADERIKTLESSSKEQDKRLEGVKLCLKQLEKYVYSTMATMLDNENESNLVPMEKDGIDLFGQERKSKSFVEQERPRTPDGSQVIGGRSRCVTPRSKKP